MIKKIPVIDVNSGHIIRERKKIKILPLGWKMIKRKKNNISFQADDGTTIICWTRPKYKGWYVAISRDNPYYTGEEDEEEMDIDIYEFVKTKKQALDYAYKYMKENNEENTPFW